jgi:hypothetical protein
MRLRKAMSTKTNISFDFFYSALESKKKSKAVPLHAMEAHGGRGGIAPAHS